MRAAARKRPQADDRLDLVTRAINEGVYDWDIARDKIVYSARLTRALGLTPQQLRTPRDWRERIHPDDRQGYDAALVAHFKGHTERFEYDYRYRAGDGSWRWARQHGIAQRDARGRAVRMIGSTGDITELKQAAEALKTSEERYALATRAATEGIYEWDVRTGMLFLSDRARVAFAIADEVPRAVDWNARVHAEDFPAYRDALVAYFAGRTPQFEHEYRIRNAAGGYTWVVDRGVARRDSAGRVTHMVGALTDVTQRKLSEIELRRARDGAQEALEQQIATSNVLHVITGALTDLAPVYQAILSSITRLCQANIAALFLYDGETLGHAASLGITPEFTAHLARTRSRPSRETTTRLAALERRPVHVADLLSDPAFSPEPRALYEMESVRTVLSVPMLRDDMLIGVITTWRREVRPFSDRQVDLVRTFADQAVIAIENARLFNETKEALGRQTATAEVLRVISSSPTDIQPVLDAVTERAAALCSSPYSHVLLAEGGRLNIRSVHSTEPGRTPVPGNFVPIDRSFINGRAFIDREIVHVPDVLPLLDTEFRGAKDNQHAFGFRACLAVPMLREGRAIGTIYVWRREPGPFSSEQIALLRTFADQAVIAIENVRLFNETREALERQTATAEILGVISSSPTDTQPVFEAIVRSGLKLFPGAAVAVALPRDGQVHAAAVADSDSERVTAWKSRFPFPLTREYMHGVAILDGRLVDVQDARQAPPGLEAGCSNFLASGYRAATMMPMLRGGEAIGTVSVLRLEPGPLSDRQLAVLRTFADQAVIAIENVRLLKETTDALEQQKASGEVLTAISSSIADTKPVFDKILESCERLFAGKIVGVNLTGEDRLMHLGAYHGRGREELEKVFPIPLDRSSGSGRSILEGRVINFADVERDPDVPETTRRGTMAIGCRSVIFAPMLWKGEAMGAIFVARESTGYFSEKETALLRTFADQAVIAIQNARLYNETTEALEQQKALAEVLGTISQSIADTKPVFDRILKSCQRLFEGHLVGLTLAGEDGQIRLGAYKGENREEMERVYPYPLGRDSGSGQAMLERKVVRFADVGAPGSDAPLHVVRGARAVGFRSIVFAPLIAEGQAIGALWVGRRQPEPIGERQVALLETFADQAVIAIRNARLFREIQEKSAQLEAANRHKSEFLASMSHELRTPLNAIIGFTRIVQRNAQGRLEHKQLENLEKIQASGEHLLALINAVLDLSKVEAGHVEVSAREVELTPVLEHCLRTVEPLVKTDAVSLERDLDGALPTMLVDDEKLRQIVINLLSNAAKFTARGSIRLCASADNGAVRIAVADTGIGIPADKLGIIFEEFRQADAGSTREYGGTGLGLAIARRLARLMGGDIDVASEPGRGSTFTLTLPQRYSA